MARVFVFGAGASSEATEKLALRMPLASGFFDAQYLNELWPAAWVEGFAFEESPLVTFLEAYYGVAFRFADGKCTQGTNKVNIEDVLSFIDSIRRNDKALYQTDRTYFQEAERRLVEYVINTMRVTSAKLRSERVNGVRDLYVEVAESLSGEDSIITFNWDTMLDEALASTAQGRVLCERMRANLKGVWAQLEKPSSQSLWGPQYLKMHGSVNMTMCDESDCPRYAIPHFFEPTEEFPEVWECDICGGPSKVCLMPPQFNKNYHDRFFFRRQYASAAHALRTAKEIVVIGYSFPPFDTDAQALFRSARYAIWEQSESSLERILCVDPKSAECGYRQRVNGIFSLDTDACELAHGRQVQYSSFTSVSSFRQSGILGQSGQA